MAAQIEYNGVQTLEFHDKETVVSDAPSPSGKQIRLTSLSKCAG